MFYCFHCELIANKIFDFNMTLVDCVDQFNFHVRDSGAISSVESGTQLLRWFPASINPDRISKVKSNVRPLFLTLGYC